MDDYHIFTSNLIYNPRPMGFYLPMTHRLSALVAGVAVPVVVVAHPVADRHGADTHRAATSADRRWVIGK